MNYVLDGLEEPDLAVSVPSYKAVVLPILAVVAFLSLWTACCCNCKKPKANTKTVRSRLQDVDLHGN